MTGIHAAQVARRVVPRAQRLEVRQPGLAAEVAFGDDVGDLRREVAGIGAGHDGDGARGQVGGKRAAQALDDGADVAPGQHGQLAGQRHLLAGEQTIDRGVHHADAKMNRDAMAMSSARPLLDIISACFWRRTSGARRP